MKVILKYRNKTKVDILLNVKEVHYNFFENHAFRTAFEFADSGFVIPSQDILEMEITND